MKPRFFMLLLIVTGIFTSAMDVREARHLLARTSFGVTPKQLALFSGFSRDHAINYILSNTQTKSTLAPIDWMLEEDLRPPKPFNQLTEEERRAFQTLRFNQTRQLKAWWAAEMVNTPSEFTEIMTMLWHNHFTSELQKVRVPHLMYRQDVLIRENALGNFADLVQKMAKDPAMIIYLDNLTNVKDHPNENFSRELLELFTLGEGNYTESDVKEAARAFTGWSVHPVTGLYRLNFLQHDFDNKVFMGEEGHFNGDDIINIILDQDRTAEFITEKLWKVFINNTPDEEGVKFLAAIFRDSGYELKPLLTELFRSDYFWNEMDQGSLVKSPVELMIGMLRTFSYPLPRNPTQYVGIARATAYLGQNLFDPPNVKGWEGGTDWITTTTLLNRRSLIKDLLRLNENGIAPFFFRSIPLDSAEQLSSWLLAVEPAGHIENEDLRIFISNVLLDPAFQVK